MCIQYSFRNNVHRTHYYNTSNMYHNMYHYIISTFLNIVEQFLKFVELSLYTYTKYN